MQAIEIVREEYSGHIIYFCTSGHIKLYSPNELRYISTYLGGEARTVLCSSYFTYSPVSTKLLLYCLSICKVYFSLDKDIKSFPVDRNAQIDKYLTADIRCFFIRKADTEYDLGTHNNFI